MRDRRDLPIHPGLSSVGSEQDVDVRARNNNGANGEASRQNWSRLAVNTNSGERARAEDGAPSSIHATATTIGTDATTKETVAMLVSED